MNARQFADAVQEALFTQSEEGELDVDRITTFRDAGLLTSDEGLVVHLEDGSSFQITVVKR